MSGAKINQAEYIKESNFILAQKGKTFFWAKFLLNKKHANKAVRLYRFCRYVDDLGDDATDLAIARLMLMQIIEDLKLGSSDHPIISDAIALFSESKIEISIPISLIQGVISDLNSVRIKDKAELIIYCYQVAGTVGLMMSKILDVTDERALSHAIDLGMAMQMTNISRDVGDDAQMNRRYLPSSLMGDIDPSAMNNPSIQNQQKLRFTVAQILNTAEDYYQSGYAGLCFLPVRARLGIAIASGLYRQIGINLIRRNYESWLFRSIVSKKQKGWLTLKIVTSCLLDRKFYFYLEPHRSRLDDSIKKVVYAHA